MTILQTIDRIPFTWITRDQVAELLQYRSPSSVDTIVERGRLDHRGMRVRLRKRRERYIHRDDLYEYVEQVYRPQGQK